MLSQEDLYWRRYAGIKIPTQSTLPKPKFVATMETLNMNCRYDCKEYKKIKMSGKYNNNFKSNAV